jgi:hypothetical protein
MSENEVKLKTEDRKSSQSTPANNLAKVIETAQRRIDEGKVSTKDFKAIADAYGKFIDNSKGMKCG